MEVTDVTTFEESTAKRSFVVFWQKLSWVISHSIWKAFFKVYIPNEEVFHHRPLLIVSNHQGVTDPWPLTITLPFRLFSLLTPIRFLASREPNHVVLRNIYRFITKPLVYNPNGVIELPPRRYDGVLSIEDKTKSTTGRLRKGEVVIVFPEGHANHQRTVSPFKRGVPFIAKQIKATTGTPLSILPVAIDWKNGFVRWSPEIVQSPAELSDKEEEAAAWLHEKVEALFHQGRT
jgi:1-acyl-sn-glycerol-3-phosphate acyltransferase